MGQATTQNKSPAPANNDTVPHRQGPTAQKLWSEPDSPRSVRPLTELGGAGWVGRIEQAKQANQAGQGASQARRTCKPRAASPRMVVTRNSSHSPRRAETEGAPSRHVSPFVLLSYSQKAALASRAPKIPRRSSPHTRPLACAHGTD